MLFIVQAGLDHAAYMDSPRRNGTEKYRIKTLCIGSDQLANVYINIYPQPLLYHVQSVVKCVSPHAQQSQRVLSESVRIITVSQIIRVISKLGLAAEYGHMSSAMCVCEPRVDCARFSSPSVGFATVSCSGDSL